MAHTRKIQLNDKLKGPKFLAPVIRTVNQMARILNGVSILSGGDVILTDHGLLLRVPGVAPKLWSMTAGDGLSLNISGGPVWRWDATLARMVFERVAGDSVTLVNGTNYVYLKMTVSPVSVNSKYVLWESGTFAFESDTSEIANTVDFADAVSGEGFAYVLLGEVTAAGGVITHVPEPLGVAIPLLWSFPMDFGPFTCAV